MKVDLESAQVIGQGNFAKVYKFFSKDHKTYLCARSVIINEEELQELEKQKEINRQLMNVSSPYILKVYGIEQTDDKILYITQYCEGGSLFQCLQSMPNNKLELQHAINISIKIARGIQVLHNYKITHRDLKPQNILLVRKFKPGFEVPQVKIADFGLSTNNIIMETLAGTKEYIAPQQAKYHNYTNAVDVWALGIILDEMLHGTPFFVGENNEEVFKKVTTSEFSVRDKNLPNEIQELLTSMLKRKAFERPTIGEVIHRLQNFFDLLKNSKVSTLSVKTIRNVDKNLSFTCQEHNRSVQYLRQNVGYCEQCVSQEIVPLQMFAKTLPDENSKLFKLQQGQQIVFKWSIFPEESIDQFPKLFKDLKSLFSGINCSTISQNQGKLFQQQKLGRCKAIEQLFSKKQSILNSMKLQFYSQIDEQLKQYMDKIW